MYTLELYRKYLYNSIKDKKNATKTLDHEREEIKSILQGVDTLFYGDEALKKNNTSDIYTLIKKEIIFNVVNGVKQDVTAFTLKFFLEGVLNEINALSIAV